eukprot:m51a1_g434 hypothetical protein (350) ;mRNA; r:59976-61162
MQYKTALVALYAVAAVASAFQLQFTPHSWPGLKPADAQWRRIGAKPLTTPFSRGSWFYSLNAEAAAQLNHDVINASAHAGAEAIVAYACVTTGQVLPSVPVAAYAFFDADALASVGLNLNDLAHAHAEAAVGAVAMAFEGLVELDNQGNEVSHKSFMSRRMGQSEGMTWVEDGHGDSADHPGAKFYRIKGTDASSGLTVFFTWIVTSEPGYTLYGKAVVVPKAFETIVEIRNYPYATQGSRLRLRVLGANAHAEAQAGAFVSQRGAKAYAEAGVRATVNGVAAVCEAGAWVDYTLDALERLTRGALMPFHGSWDRDDVKRIDIEFPSGAQVIVYDPVLATGTSPYTLSI